MTPDQLDGKAISHGVCRTLARHKDISGYAATVTADLAILNLEGE